ncbi:lyase family protein [Cutibacterium porci]|uniref:lyase family protein n=1 Tax=Cutibacterium porci TaxID=2605781 RepID=UPI002DD9F5C6|nr:lyase family protein [Cutibacterium porci]
MLDTARSLQIRDSLSLIDDCTDTLLKRIRNLAGRHAETLMVARTNGQHAVPTTLGMRFARWVADLERSRDRLTDVRKRCLLVQFSGAAGTYASMGSHGTTVAMGIARELGLVCELIAWHSSRDGLTELACNLAIHAQTLGKIAEDLYDMQRTDFQEAAEALDPHLSGSSTMPQKRNPFSTMKISAAARIAAGAAATILTNSPGDFERDHRQLEVERDAIPRILAAVDGAGQNLLKLLDVMHFDANHLDANARREGVLLVSEGIMMKLAAQLGHERAHDLLQDYSAAYRADGTSLREFVTERPEITECLDTINLEALSDPSAYTGLSAKLSRRIATGQPHTGTDITE